MGNISKIIMNVDYGALAKIIAGQPLSKDEKRGAELAKQLATRARRYKKK